jgi:hypothetical protein
MSSSAAVSSAVANAHRSVVVTTTRPVSVLHTLWTRDTIRCVFVRHLRPPAYAVQVFDGANVIYTELVDDREEAVRVAATLWAVFIGPVCVTPRLRVSRLLLT